MANTKQTSAEVKMDRRNAKDRRNVTERRQKDVPVKVERRKLERRTKVSRRRQIDPTTCERDYSIEEIEFMQALDGYKRTSGRMFPTCSEILEVIRGLGYEKQRHDTPQSTENHETAAIEVEPCRRHAPSERISRRNGHHQLVRMDSTGHRAATGKSHQPQGASPDDSRRPAAGTCGSQCPRRNGFGRTARGWCHGPRTGHVPAPAELCGVLGEMAGVLCDMAPAHVKNLGWPRSRQTPAVRVSAGESPRTEPGLDRNVAQTSPTAHSEGG